MERGPISCLLIDFLNPRINEIETEDCSLEPDLKFVPRLLSHIDGTSALGTKLQQYERTGFDQKEAR